MTRENQVRSYFYDVQTHIQHTESTQPSVVYVHNRRAAEAADAATAALGDRAPAAKPCNARAVRIVEDPQPATHGHARRGPRAAAVAEPFMIRSSIHEYGYTYSDFLLFILMNVSEAHYSYS